jgi:hypothetical protein
MTGLVASARMSAVAPSARAAWRALFEAVSRRSRVALEIIEHAFPASLNDLWTRDDLGCAFMCGWPLALENKARGRSHLVSPEPDGPVPLKHQRLVLIGFEA